ncbi:hypothetical protein [Lentzea sp. NPDC060358]|uniref:hypothetical protein n=1 Tax=Lentzea sp. NPDC060358 TaxID=3347103 RepID=UPI003656DD6C
MSWLRRLLLLAGLVTGAWLLGGAGEASADVRVEIDQLRVEVGLPVLDAAVTIAVEVETGIVPPRPGTSVPPEPVPRTDVPDPPPVPQVHPVAAPPVQVETRQVEPPPTAATPVEEPAPQQPRQPRAERPVPGTLPPSGAGTTANGTQLPAGTLPHALWPPTATTSLVSTERHDAPRTVRAEEPTFSPD